MRASFGRVDLTPRTPIALCGLGGRREPYTSIGMPIEVDAAVLREDARAAVLVSGDFLYFPGSLRDRLVGAFGKSHGISAADVLLAASHTHFAPNLDRSKPHLGAIDDDYVAFVEERVEALVGRLLQTAGATVAVRHQRLVSRHNINRRVLTIDAEAVRVLDAAYCDPGGPCDPGLDVLRFDAQRGALCGVLVRYSCDPVCLPAPLELSPEFPGVIRRKLRDEVGLPELPVLYVQGYAGQLRPEANRFRAGGMTASAEASLAPVPCSEFSRPAWEKWAGSIAGDALAALGAAAETPMLAASLAAGERKLPLAAVIEDLPAEHGGATLSIQAIKIADDMLLVAMSAEPTSAWSEIVCDLAPGKIVIPVGCANQVYGYLPSAREVAQGGWEAGDFLSQFGLDGRFRPGFAECVAGELAALLAAFDEPGAAACRDRIAALRGVIDKLWTQRDEARALMMRARAAQSAAETRLAAITERAEDLEKAAAHLRELLGKATSRIREFERTRSPGEAAAGRADGQV
ncbi:MAG TPA: hypothetical protein VGF07_12185 [Stellaceae bacterium]|jgi:hypothetical protein